MTKKTWIEILPTSHLMDIELYDTANFFIDEADYLGHMDQELLDQAISLYADKNSCKTIIASTPNSPGGLFEKIENDPISRYTKLRLVIPMEWYDI